MKITRIETTPVCVSTTVPSGPERARLRSLIGECPDPGEEKP